MAGTTGKRVPFSGILRSIVFAGGCWSWSSALPLATPEAYNRFPPPGINRPVNAACGSGNDQETTQFILAWWAAGGN